MAGLPVWPGRVCAGCVRVCLRGRDGVRQIQVFQLELCTARASSIVNPEATMQESMCCIPKAWMLKNFEISTAQPVLRCGLSHAAMGTRLPRKPPAPPPTKKGAPSADAAC
jgi:hypothetical protein